MTVDEMVEICAKALALSARYARASDDQPCEFAYWVSRHIILAKKHYEVHYSNTKFYVYPVCDDAVVLWRDTLGWVMIVSSRDFERYGIYIGVIGRQCKLFSTLTDEDEVLMRVMV